jgi:hypothetical protein
MKLWVSAAGGLLLLALAQPGRAQVICSGNIPPEGTVITATGTAAICGGGCRARRYQPAEGSTMVICAEQPIPRNYQLESVTSSPACECLGDQDNAYVVRRAAKNIGAEPPSPGGTMAESAAEKGQTAFGAQHEFFQIDGR